MRPPRVAVLLLSATTMIAATSMPRPGGGAMNMLESLRQHTTIVADTGQFDAIRAFKPQDGTTNPSLILQAAQLPEYSALVDQALAEAQENVKPGKDVIAEAADRLAVLFGMEILAIVPGRVSSEIDARLSFDTQAIIRKARSLMARYEAKGVSRDRILIKIAATWEGIIAAGVLEQEGIHCNLTLIFSLVQAVACAEANVRLISPFVGRIMDWHRAKTGEAFSPASDPGVLSCSHIYRYYKKFGYSTQIMGASFRNIGEILELAGCDLLTISPSLLTELQAGEGPVACKLTEGAAADSTVERIDLDEMIFRRMMCEDACATEKLAEGIRAFIADTTKLEEFLSAKLKPDV